MKTILRWSPLLLLLGMTGCYVVPAPQPQPVAYAPQPAYYGAPPTYYAAPAYTPAYYAPYPSFALGIYGGGYGHRH